MLLSLSWIKEYVDLEGIAPEEIAKRLALSTAEVESARWVGRHFAQVKAARIEKIEKHPNADKIRLATIFDGADRATVVCGAPNIEEGQIVPYAPLGTVLPGDFEIKPAKIRGVESRGMLCSPKELGLGDDHSGILQLDRAIAPGTPLTEIYGPADFIIEIENKTVNHRPDLWGHYGYARELRVIFNRAWKRRIERRGIVTDRKDETFAIEFSTDKALHYIAVRMSGIRIGPSPEWLRRRLEAIGQRPINNIVDITNFVMFETGHPIHAFDRKKLAGTKVVVRGARDGEAFTTLDGVERRLIPGDIVIADAQKAVALGGVMGGLHSEVDETTTEILIESALFDPATIRRTANRLDLRTEAAQRFEKAMWAENSWLAAERCVELIKELIPGATVTSEPAFRDATERYGFRGEIVTSHDRIRTLLGVRRDDLPDAKIEGLLTMLEFGVRREGEKLSVTVPPHRASKDVSIEADLVEEVGRLHGYDNIVPRAPLFPMAPAPRNRSLEREDRIRDLLVKSFAAHEIMTYSFVSEGDRTLFPVTDDQVVRVKGLAETPYLRHTMAPGLLRALAINHRQYESFTLFEFGRVFFRDREERRLALVLRDADHLFTKVRGIAETLLAELGVPQFSFERPNDKSPFFAATLLHPGRSMVVEAAKKKVAVAGEVHPAILAALDIKGRAGYLEWSLDLLDALPERTLKYEPIPRFPATFFELTVLVPERTEARDLQAVVVKTVPKETFKECLFVSSYRGTGVPEGKVSLSLRVILAAPDRTLTGEEMKEVQERLIAAFEKHGWPLKGA